MLFDSKLWLTSEGKHVSGSLYRAAESSDPAVEISNDFLRRLNKCQHVSNLTEPV